MVLVNKTKMTVSIIKKDRNIVTLKPESHLFMDDDIIGSYPSFIEVYSEEEFNKLNSVKKDLKIKKIDETPKENNEKINETPKENNEKIEEPKKETPKKGRRKKSQDKLDEKKEDK